MGEIGDSYLFRSPSWQSNRGIKMCARTTLATSTMGCSWGSRARWRRPSCLRGRLQGGKLNKARKGELRFPLPVGFCYDDQGRIVPDADDEVRGAVQLVFTLFRETGSAYAVVRRFAQSGLRFPRRACSGAWAGKLIWHRLTHSRVLGLLKNPSYAGTYVVGRCQYTKSITADGEVRKNMRAMPTPDWRVHLPDHHECYITVEEFEENLQRLARNRTNGEGTVLSGAAREGLAPCCRGC
jgi:hypothetical protein